MSAPVAWLGVSTPHWLIYSDTPQESCGYATPSRLSALTSQRTTHREVTPHTSQVISREPSKHSEKNKNHVPPVPPPLTVSPSHR
jgi:hypothetical protein